MPTYDYECTACNHKFELFQMMSAAPKKTCPKCKKKKLRRLIGSGIGIIFKGSGFYETDYKRKEPSSGSKKRSRPASAPENKEKSASDGGSKDSGSTASAETKSKKEK